MKLGQQIKEASKSARKIKIIWIPGHSDLQINEAADKCAKEALEKNHILRWIAPEDVMKEIKRRHISSSREDWEKSKYKSRLPDLMNLNKEILQSVTSNRSNDVILARLGTRTIRTNEILAKGNLSDSPRCQCGNDIEDIEHIILSCNKYDKERENLETRWE